MNIKIQFFAILLVLFSFVLLKEPNDKKDKKVIITITSTDEGEKSNQKNTQSEQTAKIQKEKSTKNSDSKEEEEIDENKSENLKNEEEKETQKLKNSLKKSSSNKQYTILYLPYQEQEDYIISPLGFGTPPNFIPLQVDTTTYKTWVISNEIEKNSAFSYNLNDSETVKETGEWDSVLNEEGIVSGNLLIDDVYLNEYKIPNFTFIEALEFEEEYKNYKFGKLGLGNCHYVKNNNICLLDKLKEDYYIKNRIFSIREYNDTHGELVIGEISPEIKNSVFPLISLVNENIYNDIEDEEFKMSWLTNISYVLFKNNLNDKNHFFDNRIKIEDGLVSFDSACHFIEAPYSYIDEFESNFFEKIIPNVCRKVNEDGTYMFFCNIERFNEVIGKINDLSFVIVIDGYGFNINMNDLFEKINEEDYEFFIHFKNYEQNLWNLGHPFFHNYVIVFDQDNQKIGINGTSVYDLKEQLVKIIKIDNQSSWWKIVLIVLLVLLILVGLFYLCRKYGIKSRLDHGVSPNLVDNESADDLTLFPESKVT